MCMHSLQNFESMKIKTESEFPQLQYVFFLFCFETDAFSAHHVD